MPPEPSDSEKSWKRAVTISAIVHVIVLLVAIFGIPFLPDRTYDEPIPIGIEVMDVSEMATTDKPEASSRKAEQKKPEEKPTPEQPPQAKEPPKPVATPKPVEKPPEKVEEAKPPPQNDLADIEEPKPKEKPEEKPTPPKEEPKKEEPKKDEPDTQEEDFQSVLKNLAPSPTDEKPAEQDMMTTAPLADAPSAGTLGDKVTMSEMDALRRQLAQCWNLTASSGAAEAEDLKIGVKLIINADRTVQSAEIVDQMRYASDEFFRAAADSAIRAVRNPLCSPLNLPPEKYDQWKSLTIRFDPSEMF